jgi:hypothetical protein
VFCCHTYRLKGIQKEELVPDKAVEEQQQAAILNASSR